jgi:hypothetical protein
VKNREITEKIIGAAIEVHSILGPGLLEKIPEAATAQTLSYLKAKNLKTALLINFGENRLVDGIKRFVL